MNETSMKRRKLHEKMQNLERNTNDDSDDIISLSDDDTEDQDDDDEGVYNDEQSEFYIPEASVELDYHKPFNAVRRTSAEEFQRESIDTTNEELNKLAQMYETQPQLVHKTKHMAKLVEKKVISNRVWYMIVGTIVALIAFFMFNRSITWLSGYHPLATAIDKCSIPEARNVIDGLLPAYNNSMELLLVDAYPIHGRIGDSILHADDCPQIVTEFQNYPNALCKYVNVVSSGQTPLAAHIRRGINNVDAVKFIIEQCHATPGFDQSLNVYDDHQDTPLRLCLIKYSSYEICSQLIALGSNLLLKYPDLDNGTLLHDPELQPEAVRFLLDQSKSENVLQELLCTADDKQRTSLFTIRKQRSFEIVYSEMSRESVREQDLLSSTDENGISVLGFHYQKMAIAMPRSAAVTRRELFDAHLETIEFILSKSPPQLSQQDLIMIDRWYIKQGSSDASSRLLVSADYLNTLKRFQRILPFIFLSPTRREQVTDLTLDQDIVCLFFDPSQFTDSEQVQITIACDKTCFVFKATGETVPQEAKNRYIVNWSDQSAEFIIVESLQLQHVLVGWK